MAGRKAGQVATTGGSEVAVRQAPPLEIESSDVSLPTIKVGQHMSNAVQEGLVAFGDIFSSVSKEDADPAILCPFTETESGLKFHVLGMTRGKSASIDGELQTYAYDDPEAPRDAWVTYKYVVAIPDHDTVLPYKLLLTKTGAPAAKQINLLLMKNSGQAWDLAFTLHAAKRENAKGKYCVLQVRQSVPSKPAEVKAHEANVAIAGDLAQIVAGSPAAGPPPVGETPDI